MARVRVLVCGGRNFDDALLVDKSLTAIDRVTPFECIIHGAARGADALAGEWARAHDIPELRYPADWKTYGKRAGILRNIHMIDDALPNMVIAFPGGRGTAHMIEMAVERRVMVVRITGHTDG